MIKKYHLLFWIVLLFSTILTAQQGNDLIKEIFLIKNPNERSLSPPQQIRIGVDMSAQAYFKFSNEDTILRAGLLKKGVNYISISTELLFEKPATHTLQLELKKEDLIIRKDILLDIQLAVMETPIKVEAEPVISEHKLSLFIENQLVSSRIKQQKIIQPIQKDLSRIQPAGDPFYVPKESDILMRNTVSIIDALLMSYQLIKSVAKKKTREEPELGLQHTHSLSIKFLRENPQGVEEEVIAMIGLTIK
jgi:hypothetical protein